MTDSLPRITAWLAAHAPRILTESLNPGALEVELAELAAAVGRPLPADYQQLYRWHNGLNEEADNFWGSLWYGMRLLPLAEVLAAYQYQAGQPRTSPLRRAAPGVAADVLQNPHWLRLSHDWSHGWLLVDLAPTAASTYGQVLYLDELAELAFPVAGSVAELLATFANDLEAGLYSLDEGALEFGDEFLRPADHINLDNWAQTKRWRNALTESA